MFSIIRKTKLKNYYSKKKGMVKSPVTEVKLCFLGINLKTMFKYRQTYDGSIKEIK